MTRPLRRWEDIAADMQARGLPPERVEQVQKKYLDAWQRTEKPGAPAYQESELLSPRVLKHAEMTGGDTEALTAEVPDPNEGKLSRLARAAYAGVKKSPAAGLAGVQRSGFRPEGLAEEVAEGVPAMLLDPAFVTEVTPAGRGVSTLSMLARALGSRAGQFGVSGAENAVVDAWRKGESPALADVLKGGAKGAATGAVVGALGSAAEKVSTRPIVRQIAKTAGEATGLTAAEQAEREMEGPPRTWEERLEDTSESAARNTAMLSVLNLIGGVRARQGRRATAETEHPPMASEAPQNEGPGEPGTGAGGTPPEPRFVRELQDQQAAQDAAAEIRRVEGIDELGTEPEEPVELTEDDVLEPRFVGTPEGDVVDQEVPVELGGEDIVQPAVVPPVYGGLPARQEPRGVPATPDQLAGEVVEAELVDPFGEPLPTALPAPGEASDYIPPEAYPREVQWQEARGSSGPFPSRGSEPAAAMPPEPPVQPPGSPVQPSGKRGGTQAPPPAAPPAERPLRSSSTLRAEIAKMENRRAGAKPAERIRLSAKIGRMKEELQAAVRSERVRMGLDPETGQSTPERVAEAEARRRAYDEEQARLKAAREQPVEGLDEPARQEPVDEDVPRDEDGFEDTVSDDDRSYGPAGRPRRGPELDEEPEPSDAGEAPEPPEPDREPMRESPAQGEAENRAVRGTVETEDSAAFDERVTPPADIRQSEAQRLVKPLGENVGVRRRSYRQGGDVEVIDRATNTVLGRGKTYRHAVEDALAKTGKKPEPGRSTKPPEPAASVPERERSKLDELRERRAAATERKEQDRLDREITLEGALQKTRKKRATVAEKAESVEAPASAEGAVEGAETASESAPPRTRKARERQTKDQKRERALLRRVEKEWNLDERLDHTHDWGKPGEPHWEKDLHLALGRALEWKDRANPDTKDGRRAAAAVRTAQHDLAQHDEWREEYEAKQKERKATSDVPFDIPEPDTDVEPGMDEEHPRSRGPERGAVGGAQRPAPYHFSNKKVDDMFAPLGDPSWRGKLRELPEKARAAWQAVKERFGEIFEYEYRVKDQPELRNALRLFLERRGEQHLRSNRDLAAIVEPLKRDGEYEQLRRLVALEDMVERGNAGQQLAGDLTVEEAIDAHDELQRKATPAVRRAIAMHRALMRQEAVEQVRRGVLSPEVLDRAIYYPHKIVELSNDLIERTPAFGRKLREPYRPWAKKAQGSARAIDMDYIGVMHSHLMRVRLANAMDDFAYTWLNKLDAMDELPAAQRAKITKAGQVLEIGDRKYETYAYRPGRQLAADIGSTNGTIDAALDILVPAERYYVIPQNVARRFDEFRQPKGGTLLGDDFRAGWTLWKRLWVDTLGLKFNVMNMVGDAAALYREDTLALLNSVSRANEIFHLLRGEGKQDIQRILHEQGITETATLFGADVDLSGAERTLRRFQKYGTGTGVPGPGEVGRQVVGLIEGTMAKREQWFRIAKALTDYDRIQNNQRVKTKTVNIEGLTAEAALGKVAREFAVDYAAVSPAFKGTVRGWLAPFSTWFIAQARDWPRYMTHHPVEAAAKFGAPLAALYYWNNVKQKDVERRNPEYLQRSLFHLNTGYQTEDGRDIVISWQTGLDVAAQVMQLDRLYQKAGRVQRGETPRWQDAREFLTPKMYEVAEDAAKFGLRMAPIANIATGLASGRDPFTQRPIVRQGMSKEAATRAKAWFVLQQLIPFVAQYDTAMRRAKKEGTSGSKIVDFIQNGPLDWESAYGKVEVDPLMGELGVMHRNVDEAVEHRAKALEGIQAGAVEAQTGGSSAPVSAAMREGAKAGVSAKDVTRRLGSTTHQLAVLERRLEQAETPEARRGLERDIRNMRVRLMVEGLKSKPKSARQAVGAP